MKFVRVHQLADGVEPLRDRLLKELADGKRVVWLVPGGSNIPLTVAVMAQLPDELTAGLTILLTDERFGPVGHPDSNAHQLDETGFLPKQATVVPVLRDNLSLPETIAHYAAAFTQATGSADVIIGQFGMGADGHIAGILPGSVAVRSADMAAGYVAPNFTRITLTPNALRQLTAAYVFAFGSDKRLAMQRLQAETLSLDEQPAQIIKHIPDSYVYNDQID
ncbi:MAG TPA: 6-phosphogluconolactonase [Candidatus Saccharimonadales bacterium]|jgi:6-phosphogluconolactonase/glucosamine-6-phosphate isomerase/deaminase